MFRLRLSALVAIATAFLLVASAADARPLGGFSAGSRGMRTYSAPPSTATAPSAAPQRSLTRPPTAAPFGGTAPRSGFFSGRGLFGGLAAGFLGAGLLGMLFGYGFFGGMAGFASILGLLLQIVLIVIVARLIFAWWRRRNSPAAAYAGSGHSMGYNFASLGGMSSGAAAQTSTAPVTITKSDYDAFERLLGDVQYAFSAEDLSALRGMLEQISLGLNREDSQRFVNERGCRG